MKWLRRIFGEQNSNSESVTDSSDESESEPKRKYVGPSLEEIDKIGSIRAWRAWNVKYDDDGEPVLQSTAKNTLWPTPRMEADGPPSGRKHKELIETTSDMWRSPRYEHHGIYALKPLACAKLFGYAEVVGEIDLFGRVIEHGIGYRAEKAVIRKLYLTPVEKRIRSMGLSGTYTTTMLDSSAGINDRLASGLEHRYDCDVDCELGQKMADHKECEQRRKQNEFEKESASEEPEGLTPGTIRQIVREEMNRWILESRSGLFMSSQMKQRCREEHREKSVSPSEIGSSITSQPQSAESHRQQVLAQQMMKNLDQSFKNL